METRTWTGYSAANAAVGTTVLVLVSLVKVCHLLRAVYLVMTKCKSCIHIKQILFIHACSILKGGLMKDRTSFQLSFSDVRSLYPRKGVSDHALDFFVRYIHQAL